ncbi:MAG TPA: right-handed parallel beta-helix repeat-containing protein, partial [Paenirhodobacter sp.]
LDPASGLPQHFPNPVTILSADPAHPARFTALAVINTGNIVLDGLYIDYSFRTGDQGWQKNSELRGVTDVTLRNTVFDGDVARGLSINDDGYGYLVALGIRDSRNVTVANNRIFRFAGGIQTGHSQNVTIRGNDISGLRIDGMQFTNVQDILIEGNYVHDFRAPPTTWDHRDMIQFWTARTDTPSARITIRSNVLFAGGGDFTQSIFMGNERVANDGAGREMYYRDVTIEDNVIVNAHFHGISPGASEGLTIRRNTLIQNPAAKGPDNNPSLWSPGIRVDQRSINVTVEGNITMGLDGYSGQPGWKIAGNLLVGNSPAQSKGAASVNPVAATFGNVRLSDPTRIDSYAYLPGSAAARGEYGAAALRPDRIAALTAALPAAGAGAKRAPDTAPEPARLIAFGTTATPGGARVPFQPVSGKEKIPVSFAQGEFTIGAGQETAVLNGPELLRIGGASQLNLALRFQAAKTADPSWVLFSAPGVLTLSVTPRGTLGLMLTVMGQPPRQLQSGPLRLHDGEWHDIRLSYDAAAGLNLSVDGVPAMAAEGAGRLAGMTGPVVRFGGSAREKTFEGQIGGLRIAVNGAD